MADGMHTEAARKARIDSLSRNAKSINFKKVVMRRRKQNEIPSLRVAIRNHCLECMGYQTGEVPICTSPECWLYPWRMGKLTLDNSLPLDSPDK